MLELSRLVRAMQTGIAASLIFCAQPILAQCTNPWSSVPGSPGVEGEVRDTLVFDPDGPGPIGERVLVSGRFEVAGEVSAQNLAVYDPGSRTWSAFGPGPYPADLLLGRDSTGVFYFAGEFASIAGIPAARLAAFDGTTWWEPGGGLNGTVFDMTVTLADEVIVTGGFSTAGGVATQSIAKWDGSSWSSLGSTLLASAFFRDVAVLSTGQTYAIVQLGGITSSQVLEFNGTTWQQLGAPFLGSVSELFATSSDDLIVGCGTLPGHQQQHVGRWNGTNWVPLPNAPLVPSEFVELPGGQLACCQDSFGGQPTVIAIWDGVAWTQIGSVPPRCQSISVLANGNLLVGGLLQSVGGTAVRGVALWNGSVWSPASVGIATSVDWLEVDRDGAIYAASASGFHGNSLVNRWTGAGWAPLGGGYPAANTFASALGGLFALPSGRLLTGGVNGSQSTAAPLLQEWTGSSWSTLATSGFGRVEAVIELPDGDLVVAGEFDSMNGVAVDHVARFDGTQFYSLGEGLPARADDLVQLPDGDILALVYGSVFRWGGDDWLQMGLSVSAFDYELLLDNDGVPVLAGDDVRRWNGVSWEPLGNVVGPVAATVALPNGDLVVGPLVGGLNPSPRPLQRWDGVSWTPFGGDFDATVDTLAVAANGDLLVGGDFTRANGEIRTRFARVSTTCAASVVYESGSCSSFFGINLLSEVLPWIGGTCRSRAEAMQPDSLAVEVFGVQSTSVPLSTWWPVAGASCELAVQPDWFRLAVPANGELVSELAIANNPALVGVSFREQVIEFRWTPGLATLQSVRSSNVLHFQIGSF